MTIPIHFLFTYIAVFTLVLSNVNTYNLYSRANDMVDEKKRTLINALY